MRLRRIKAGILRASIRAGVYQVLANVGYSYPQAGALSEKFAAGDESARQKVDSILAKAGLTIGEATAKTLENKLDSFERLDRMLASAEARRNNAFERSTVTATHWAAACVDQSKRLRTGISRRRDW